MNHSDKEMELLRGMHALADVRPDAEATARAIDRARGAVLASIARPSSRTARRISFGGVGALAAALAAIVFLAHWWTPAGVTGGVAFGQVQEQIEKIKSVQYLLTRTVRIKGQQAPAETETRKVTILGRHRMREEVTTITAAHPAPNRYVSISNLATGKMIDLDPEKKTYDLPQVLYGIDLDGNVKRQKIEPAPQCDFYKRIREIPAGEAKKLPDHTIDGKLLVGFQVVKQTKRPAGTDTWTGTYWIDPQTKLPVRIELSNRSTNPAMADSDSVISELVFDAPLDEALLSTDPPDGYQPQTPDDAGKLEAP